MNLQWLLFVSGNSAQRESQVESVCKQNSHRRQHSVIRDSSSFVSTSSDSVTLNGCFVLRVVTLYVDVHFYLLISILFKGRKKHTCIPFCLPLCYHPIPQNEICLYLLSHMSMKTSLLLFCLFYIKFHKCL